MAMCWFRRNLLVLLALVIVPSHGSGDGCIACQLIAGLAGQGALTEIQKAVKSVCHDKPLCYGPLDLVLDAVAAGETPDKACAKTKLCTTGCILYSSWPVQHSPPEPPLWPPTSPADVNQSLMSPNTEGLTALSALMALSPLNANPCGLNVTCNIHRFADQHLPLEDSDGDGFGASEDGTFRNWHWRGKDCQPTRDDIYPGRKQPLDDPTVDHNCNGIVGGNASGSYEEMLCAGSGQRGLMLLGDSATAHFHIPPQWITAAGWKASGLLNKKSLLTAEDELDWPQCSWGTGFADAKECPYPFNFTTVSSLASRLRDRNRCNHRDYQNLGVNGARVSVAADFARTMSRAQQADHPALVLLSMIGNDVCNGHPGMDHMTTPADFENRTREALAVLDSKLPNGSSVLAIGLVDGRVLWDSMHALQHPSGASYADVYSFLSCNGANPCWGWLNANETWRNATTERAMQLNQVYLKIAAERPTFQNFKFLYHEVDWRKYIAEYVKSGGKAADLIEPVDGFHPSQAGNMYMADQIWQWLEQNHPEVLGPTNPHNGEIQALFGDQGGF